MLHKLAKIFRAILFVLVALLIVTPFALYILLSSEYAQNKIRDIAQTELTSLLGTEVNIGSVKYSPFNMLEVSDISAKDDNDSTALTINRIDTRFELLDLLVYEKLIIDYATIDGLDLKLYRDSTSSPINIQRIVERLTKKDENKANKAFALRINDVSIINSSLSYNVLSEPVTHGVFNNSHIELDNIELVAFLPLISTGKIDNVKSKIKTNGQDYRFNIRTLSFTESSGFKLSNLSADCIVSESYLNIKNIAIDLPKSRIALSDINYPINGFDDVSNLGVNRPVNIAIEPESHIYLPDIKAFVPVFDNLDYDFNINVDITGTLKNLHLSKFNLSDDKGLLSLDVQGNLSNIGDIDNFRFSDFNFDLTAGESSPSVFLSSYPGKLNEKLAELILQAGRLSLKGKADGSFHEATVDASLSSALAVARVDGSFIRRGSTFDFEFNADVDSVQLGTIISNPDFKNIAAVLKADGMFDGKYFSGDVDASVKYFDFKDHRYSDIDAKATVQADNITAHITSLDHKARLEADLKAGKEDNKYYADISADIINISPDSLGLTNSLKGYTFSGNIAANGFAYNKDSYKALLKVNSLCVNDASGKKHKINEVEIDADNLSNNGYILLTSDFINASVNGSYNVATIVPFMKNMGVSIVPALASKNSITEEGKIQHNDISGKQNNFNFEINITDPESLCGLFNLPLNIIDKAEISGSINQDNNQAYANVSLPWLLQGQNLIEGTDLTLNMDGADGECVIYAKTDKIPTKKGDMEFTITVNGRNGIFNSGIDWMIEREKPINGNFSFLTSLFRDESYKLGASIDFEDGKINFGDNVWNIAKSNISYANNMLLVNNFSLSTITQNININGIAGPKADDELDIKLKNIQLIDIFETLDIDNALIGGFATGDVFGRGLLGKNPELKSKALKVKDIAYNYCVLGDAIVDLSLDNETKLFTFDADITDDCGRKSYLNGFIEPATERLDLNIDANHVKVGFMKPFMSAFTSDVTGFASGKAHLYGTFKDIDLTGDIKADSLRIKIDFTNTWYSAQDSIHITPGRINLNNITLYDDYGNTATLNGWVGHEYFHNATFDFNITDARNFLCYDVTEKLSEDWYGRIFGNGTAKVKGRPGVVDIIVNMSTAENSTFTFVLSDKEVASEYSFITFRDATPKPKVDTIIYADFTPQRVVEIKKRIADNNDDSPTAYNMDINMGITPQAQVIIVMDPVGGDRIKAYGRGDLRMTYGSIENDLHLYGNFILEKGSYNFTLQDIIIKDFTIKEGSSISFLGDPYAAKLDIDAYYQVNANLSDLDESFLQDKDLNRTNVPVRAILKVKDDMRQPDISFDLEFPTLTQDTYRKVRSIVSTEDMMNRQIIYLLALNRFYTPEYMASTTKGNEIFSVASSTISSQLSSILGKLSENWSIAPNLRSDRGDFSDLEVDVSLSSSLLNNRLLFNGNFGYRDKAMNNSQFIGDFDVEYLMSRNGTWRLKAYNRYNDQNYYLRTAQTTQGIGLVYRRDFDNIFSFLKRKNKKEENDEKDKKSETNDSTIIVEISEDLVIEKDKD